MKDTKKIIAVIMIATIICSIFVACSRGNEREEDSAVNNAVQENVENNTQDIAENNTEDKDNTTNEVTDAVTVNAAKSDEQNNKEQTVTNEKQNTTATTNKKETTTAKKQETTTKKKVETTTKKAVTTTKKNDTTTKKPVKNVTPKEVQDQVNAYIKSKGATLDAVNAYGIHMTPDEASWSMRIARSQEDLNNGYTLKSCKWYVDDEIAHGAKYLYCYYDSNWFYVLWLD